MLCDLVAELPGRLDNLAPSRLAEGAGVAPLASRCAALIDPGLGAIVVHTDGAGLGDTCLPLDRFDVVAAGYWPVALEHLAHFQRALIVCERLPVHSLKGLLLTKRTTPTSLGSRAFSGSDARLQSREVVVLISASAAARHLLVTSCNRAAYALRQLAAAKLLPACPLALEQVFAALPLDDMETPA